MTEALVEAVMYTGQPGTSDGALFTVPAGHNYIISKITLANTTGTAATVTLGRGGTTAAVQLVPGVSVAANSSQFIDGPIVVVAGASLNGKQGTGSAVTVDICGADHTL